MKKEIIVDGHKWVMREDGLYEPIERYEVAKEGWSAEAEHANFTLIADWHGDTMSPVLLATDIEHAELLASFHTNPGPQLLMYAWRNYGGEDIGFLEC